MGKKVVKIIFLILVFIGISSGVFITMDRKNEEKKDKQSIEDIFNSVQSKNAIVTNFYTYGDTLNIEGKIENILKDNFEGAKIILSNGKHEEKISLDTYFDGKNLYFSTSQINNAVELDKLDVGNYYILFRLKLNNSSIPKLYFLSSNESISEK